MVWSEANKKWYTTYYANNRDRIRANQKAYYKKTGLRGIGLADYRVMLKSMLRHRDKGICGICGLPVAVGDESVDHIIQRAHGGSDEHDNIRLAHRRCNMTRPRRRDA